MGPDGVAPGVVRECAEQLAEVYTDIINTSLLLEKVQRIFKHSLIVPVLKKTNSVVMNDFRPVALTSVTMKCLEKLVLKHINSVVPEFSRPPAVCLLLK